MPRISPLMLLPPAIFLVFVLMFAVGMWREDPDALPSTRIGRPAPPLQLTEMPGMPTFSEETLRDGQVKIVNFWASWCAPCRAEHPNLDMLAKEGLAIYGINYKDDPAKARGFLDGLGNPYAAIGVDAQGRTALDWGLYGVPETFVLSGDGTVILRFPGPLTQRVIAETLRPALVRAAR